MALVETLNVVCSNTNVDDKFNKAEVRIDTSPFYILTLKSERNTIITFIGDTYSRAEGFINISIAKCFVSNKYNSNLAKDIMGILKLLLGDNQHQLYIC